jgi:hypothetical protein
LSLLEHVPELDADQRALGSRKRFEPQHGTGEPYDDAVGLRYDISQRWQLTDDNRRAVCLIVAPGGGGIGLAPINRDLFRRPMTLDGLGEEAPGRLLVALLREQEINGLPHFIDGAIQVPPVPAYFDIGIGLPGATEKFWAVKP